jgi:hypothetical protein
MLDRHQKTFGPQGFQFFKPVFFKFICGLHISHQMIIFHENKWPTFFWKKNKFILAIRCAPYSDEEWKNTTILRRPIILLLFNFLSSKEMGREKLVC